MDNKRNVNLNEYLDRMTRSTGETSKARLLEFCTGPKVLDFGCGSGVLTHMIADAHPDWTVYGIESNPEILKVAKEDQRPNEIFKNTWPVVRSFDTIIFSSVLHEIYSYPNKYHQAPFDRVRVLETLSMAAEYLKKGGTLLIRDGAYNNDLELVKLKFKTPDGIHWWNKFAAEFKAPLKKTSPILLFKDGCYAPMCMVKEFLYTYTWGPESWDREIQECMGVYPLSLYEKVLKIERFEIINATEFTELGYNYYLGKLVDLMDFNGKPIPLPHSTIFIVAKKI